MEAKLKEAEKAYKKANKMTTLTFTRWAADWSEALPLYEQSATTFKLAKQYDKAKECYIKASAGHQRQGTPWTAGQRLESAALMAKEEKVAAEVADLYKQACELFKEAGRPGAGAEALFKGARAVEDELPDEAVQMYMESCSVQEEEGKESNASECFRGVTNLFLKLKRYDNAASMLLRWGLASDKLGATQAQCKAYLGAVVVYLYKGDLKQARQCYADCSAVDAFFSSEQGRFAEQLLDAYADGNEEEVKYLIKNNATQLVNHLDHMIVRLARQLPTGKLTPQAEEEDADYKFLDGDDLT